ncbi:hypothetical protein FBU59_006603 [Linderina macrospora]|uniref:Uncharacterized protein n=1 Tax=Linderina macrospora TaxID=4868 RepID=A0ACC1IZF9_9FUNG|nr:hypothetical protein FBU59_006603 [Linderina macrospora]
MLFRMLVSRCVRPVENFIIDMNYSYEANGLQLSPQTSFQWFQPTLMNPAVRLPNLFAESLEALTMHSICTPMLWHKFFATPASPTLLFTNLRSLSLRFNPEVMEAPRLTHRYQHIAFPALTKLSLACYNFNIDILLSIFPKHQIQVLEVCQDWNRFKIDLSLFASLERLTVNDRGYAVRNGVQAQHWFTNSVCSILPFRLLSHLEVHSLRAYDLPRALALPCFANLKRLGISCSHDSTLIPRFLLPDVLYARGYVPIHAGIRHVTVRGPVLEGDINRRCVQQLVCIWAGMPGLQFVTLTQSFKKHMDYFKFEIKALVQSESLGRHVQHLNSIYVQFP